MYTLAVDVGGTKIASGVLNGQNEWLAKAKGKSNPDTSIAMYKSLLECIETVLSKASLSRGDIGKIGIAIPGMVDKKQGIAVYQNNLPWRNFPLKRQLKNQFPNAEIVVEHDVAAATIGEWTVRRLKNEMFVYITVSTGVAAGMVYKGDQLMGKGLAGEIGFSPVMDGADVETTASGLTMENEMKRLYNKLTLQEAFSLWGDGDKELTGYFNKKALVLAKAIFNVTAMMDPHKIVLGGGVINHQPHFYQLILNQYKTLCTHPIQKEWPARIEKSILLGDSGLYGAAMAT